MKFFLVFSLVLYSHFAWGTFYSEIILGPVIYESNCGSFFGLELKFNVFHSMSEEKIWSGRLRFSSGRKIATISQYRALYRGNISLKYYLYPLYSSFMNENPPYHCASADEKENEYEKHASYFEYQQTENESEILSHHGFVTWRINSVFLKIEDVVRAIESLKKKEKYPQYKFIGYDWDLYVANCVSFSAMVLEKLGIQISNCKQLKLWLEPINDKPFQKLIYYTIGFGYIRDNIQAQYLLKELFNHRTEVLWNFQEASSRPPSFRRNSIIAFFGTPFGEKFHE